MAVLRIGLLLALLGFAAAECPNACSGHGQCGAFDKCICYRNWQAADCSERKWCCRPSSNGSASGTGD
jgi:hypothetical protein